MSGSKKNQQTKEVSPDDNRMVIKYPLVVSSLQPWPDSRISFKSKNRLEIISSGGGRTTEMYTIAEQEDKLRINWKLIHFDEREQSRQWVFNTTDSQEKMLETMATELRSVGLFD